MLYNLSIFNFQSHKNTILEFDKGVNILIGNTDSGKSSIIRSLNWVINNKPSGEEIISHFIKNKEKTKVEIELDNQIISRIRNKKDNKYEIIWDIEIAGNSLDYKPSEYKAMGQGVPEEVSELLNFSDINFQFQLDNPFLLSSTAGEAARYLNKIVNLDKIDDSLSKIEIKRRECNSNIQYNKNQLEKLNDDIKKYDNLDKIEKQIKELEIVEKEYKNLKKQYTNLIGLITKIKEIEEEQKQYTKILKCEEEANKLLNINNKVKKLRNRYNLLFNMIQNNKNIKKNLNKKIGEINKKDIEYKKIMPKTCPLCEQEIKK